MNMDKIIPISTENATELRTWHAQYVPVSGIAPTKGGEIVRAIVRLDFRFYNDGDMVGWCYGNETCNSSDRYLCSNVPGYFSIETNDLAVSEKAYEKVLLNAERIVYEYLSANPELFNTPNTEDSRPRPTADDIARAREQEKMLYPEDFMDEEDEY